HGTVRTAPMVVVLACGGVGAIAVATIPWATVRSTRALSLWMYSWAVSDIVLVTIAVALTGGHRSGLFVLYYLTTLFVASAFPRPAQAALLCLTLVGYAAAVGAGGWSAAPAVMFIRL